MKKILKLRCFVRSAFIDRIIEECESYEWFKNSIRFDHTDNLACVLTVSASPAICSGIISNMLTIVNGGGNPTLTLEFLFDRSEVTTFRGPYDVNIYEMRKTVGLSSLNVVSYYLNGSTDKVVRISGSKEAIVKCVCQIMKILTEGRIVPQRTDSFNPQKHGPYIGCIVDQKLNSFESQEKEMIAKMVEQGIVAIVHEYLQCGPRCPPFKLAIPLVDNPVETRTDNLRCNIQAPVIKDLLNPPATNQQGSSKSNDRSQTFAPQTDNFEHR